MTFNEIREKIIENKTNLKSFGVKKIGFFGSHVRNEATIESDIDIIVVFEEGKKSFDNFMDLHESLESLYGEKIDLVTKESISKYILPYIEEEAVYEEL